MPELVEHDILQAHILENVGTDDHHSAARGQGHGFRGLVVTTGGAGLLSCFPANRDAASSADHR